MVEKLKICDPITKLIKMEGKMEHLHWCERKTIKKAWWMGGWVDGCKTVLRITATYFMRCFTSIKGANNQYFKMV